MADIDTATLREIVKADVVATRLREAVKLCLEAGRSAAPAPTRRSPPARAITAASAGC
jgi:hypothetical protein